MTTPVIFHDGNRQRCIISVLCAVWLVFLATRPDAAAAAGKPFADETQQRTPALSWEADSAGDKTARGWQGEFSSPLPPFAGWAFGGVVGLLIGVAGMALLLRHQVRMRTRHLEDVNASLRESERRFQRTVADAPFPMMVHAEDGEVLVVNRVWTEITGYSSNEIPTIAAWTERAYGTRREQVVADIDRLYSLPGRVDEGEYTIATRNGTQRVWAFSSSPVGRMPDGRRLVLSMAADVTERRDAEAKLQRNERLLRLFVEHSPAAIAMFDRSMRYIVASRRYLQDYGLGDQALTGRSHYDVFPEMPERWKEIHRRCLAGAVKRCDEDPFPRQDGTLDWVRWEIHPWYEDGGEIGGIILFSEVITERKRLDETLRRNEEFLSAIYANTNVGIFVVAVAEDGSFRYEGINPTHEQLLGHTNAEIAGKSPDDLAEYFGQESMDAVKALYMECVQQRAPVESEFYVPAGSAHGWWFSRLTPLFDAESGRVVRLIGTGIIITERKQAEEELRLSRDRLADLSQRLLEAYESERRAIGRELHDQFGQMLTAMKITLDLAGQLPSEAAAKKIGQAQGLVSELLQRVSRLSLELRPTMLDDLGLVPALLWHVNRYQEQTGIAVAFKHSGVEGRRFATAIETTAYRIIQEALTNVARHAHATHVALTLRVSEGWMGIHISDDGVGFDPEVALANRRGLAAMRERVLLVGGAFHLESEKGTGTRKTIELPLTEETP